MNPRTRVAITGVGVVSPIGQGSAAFWEALRQGRSGIQLVSRDTEEWPAGENGEPFQWLAAEVRDFQPPKGRASLRVPLLDRFAQFALVAAQEAIQDAGEAFLQEHSEQTAVVLGTAVGGDAARNTGTLRVYRDLRPHPLTIIQSMTNSAVSLVTMAYGLRGPAFSVTSACSSANHAIGQAFNMVRSGAVPVALAGGSEMLPSYSLYRAWQEMRVLSATGCRPFCRERDGLVLGEGAAILVLESLSSARSRGAHIYAELLGFGTSSDATDFVRPQVDGLVRALASAVRDSGINPEDVDYINAHGTGTKVNDATEATALRRFFGSHTEQLAVSSTKSMHGHALGAAGALELVASVMTVREDIVPPTAGYLTADPEIDLDIVANVARKQRVDVALSNSFAFGGLNAVLALRKYE